MFKSTSKLRTGITLAASAVCLALGQSASAQTTVTIDPTVQRFAINPNIYGVSHLMSDGYTNITAQQIKDLNTPLVRYGGDLSSTYNWTQNADNHGADYYFESILENGTTPAAFVDGIFSMAKSSGAQAMITLPMMNYVAAIGAGGASTWSFSVKKYGAQTAADGDAGYGVAAAGNPKFAAGSYITGNNPLDSCVPLSSANNGASLVKHMVGKFGTAPQGGVKYYIMDNEPGYWCGTHRDVHPNGTTMNEILSDITTNVAAAHAVDANALIVGPEECNWASYFYSGSDIQYANTHNAWGNTANLPDRKAHGGMDYIPWLLQSLHAQDVATGKTQLNVFSLHWYPQGNEYSNADDAATQLARNTTTRSLWDPTYADPDLSAQEGSPVKPGLIPQMTKWLNQYYPGRQKAITEYNWGDESNMNGATAQADVLGIFGKNQLDMATRWGIPSASTPTYQAMKMFRNYDGNKSTFGDISIGAPSPDPDHVAVFSSIRSSDGAMTIMAINKTTSAASYKFSVYPGFNPIYGQGGEIPFHEYQLTSANPSQIVDLGTKLQPYFGFYDGTFDGTYTLPAQSISLFVIAANSVKYDFELGSTEGWQSFSKTVGVSTSQNAAESMFASLACNVAANTTSATVSSQVGVTYPAICAGKTLTVPCLLPTGQISARAYVQMGGAIVYGNWVTTQGSWTNSTITVPSNFTQPITQIGVQFSQPTGDAGGTVYVDAVTW